MTFHPGVNEIEWLAELKTIAERIGAEVFGRPLHWKVERSLTRRRNRSDVVVTADDGTVVFTGEAKRPDDPHGVTPLDAREVDDAVAKAQHHGSRWCFTTNFHQIAVFDAGPGLMASPLSRLQGKIIEFLPRSLANAVGWWAALPESQKEEAAAEGLRRLFERCYVATLGQRERVALDDVVVDLFSQLTGQLVEPLWRHFLGHAGRQSSAIRQRALTAGLDPEDDQQCRYLVAQGVFEVMSAGLFYKLLVDHFEQLGPLLRGTTPAAPRTLHRTIVSSLKEAEDVSGDYESILRLSAVGEWVLSHSAADTLRLWNALIAFIDRLELGDVASDILGSIFERLISPERRHEMGQHYTQPRVARSMAMWGVRERNTSVLDPTCGAGTFLVETYARHRALDLSHEEILAQTFGNDLDPFAVHLTAINLVTKRIRHGLNHPIVRLGDALDLKVGSSMLSVRGTDHRLPAVDLVIANPPYSRSHPNEASALARIQRLLGRTDGLPDTTGINLGAWFVLLGTGLLARAGRMAFVLQSGVLQNENLASWRRWIRGSWDLVVWHTEDDVWFSDARVATCVILFSPRAVAGSPLGRLSFVNVREPASGLLLDAGMIPVPAHRVEVRDLSDLAADADVLIAGNKPDILSEFERAPCTIEIRELATGELGAGQKLGHSFFKLRDLHPDREGVLRTVEGLNTTFRIAKNHLTPILSSPKDLKDGQPILHEKWLLTLPARLPSSAAVRQYIRYGVSQGVHQSPSVESRGDAWWSMSPRLWQIAVPMNAQFRHQVAWLSPQGAVTNNFNAIRLANTDDSELVAASLASAFGALARLYISGEVGCEGARRVLLIQFEQWPVLDPVRAADVRLRERCIRVYREWRHFEGSELDEMPADELRVWTDLTTAVAAVALGRGASAERIRDLAERAIREARATVARRRAREAMALGGRTRASSGSRNSLSTRVRQWSESSADFTTVVELLTSGSRVLPLREEVDLANLGLFPDEHSLSAAPEAELELIRILGGGFEAAWPDPQAHSEDLAQLLERLRRIDKEVTHAVLGAPPPKRSAARETWEQLAASVRESLRRLMQGAVRSQLT